MAHLVICSKCGKQFDRDKIQAVKSGPRRYAHYECMPEGEKVPLPPPKEKKKDVEEENLIKLKEYINKLFDNSVNWPLVMKQIKTFKEENNYTYSGMLKSLIYFYEVKGNHVENSKGIGIIPYAYKDAYNYYYSLFVAQSQNEKVDFKKITSKVREITIKPPCIKKKVRIFNEEEEDDNEQ